MAGHTKKPPSLNFFLSPIYFWYLKAEPSHWSKNLAIKAGEKDWCGQELWGWQADVLCPSVILPSDPRLLHQNYVHDDKRKLFYLALRLFKHIVVLGVAAFVSVGAKRGEVIVMRKLIGRRWICNQGKISSQISSLEDGIFCTFIENIIWTLLLYIWHFMWQVNWLISQLV